MVGSAGRSQGFEKESLRKEVVRVTEKPRPGNQQGASREERGPMTSEGDNSISLLQISPVETLQPSRSQSPGAAAQESLVRELDTGDSYHQEKVGILRFRC